ncbi:uncharacterized protein LOC142220558 [Haematobia irritans]|uniref:uncharacterized protein LOC142220558 n=1 Tax=Haematobia irritans TaxID=7368 RepID=UPI003F506F53
MNFFKKLLLFTACVLTFCNGQRDIPAYRYPVAQRRASGGYSYTSPASYNSVTSTKAYPYNKANNGYYTASNSIRSTYPTKSYTQTSSAYRYPGQSSNSVNKGYSSANRYSNQNSNAVRGYSSSRYYSPTNSVRGSGSSSSTKDYPTNSYNRNYQSSASSAGNTKSSQNKHNKDQNHVSKADAENAKFAGAGNQEAEEESERTALHFKRKKLLRRRLAAASYGNRCFPYGRDATSGKRPPKEQGRFLFDLNVYNVYPQTSVGIGNGCGGFGGSFGGSFGAGGGIFGDPLAGYGDGIGAGGGGGGLLSDPLADPLYPTTPGLNQFLGAWAPGILQNSLAVTSRPPLADPNPSSTQADESDPEVDPDYRPPVRRPVPNRVYYDSAGAAPITPGQLVGGVATTVNGIIQQLTGNLQPVYQSPYRRSYG